ncbi:zf-HC2 domain-containing protein [Streptomyces sp. NPDC093970]|uniref:zf-HC2 domain-containing protein n=1 Tax=Streptomyces sp. NPDC093970 TaxID=3155076 RepID=UPI0034225BFE
MTATWHVSAALAARYADGTAAEADAWSVEKHVEVCGDCAAGVSATVRTTAAATVLTEVRDSVLAEVTRPARARGSAGAWDTEGAWGSARARDTADAQGFANAQGSANAQDTATCGSAAWAPATPTRRDPAFPRAPRVLRRPAFPSATRVTRRPAFPRATPTQTPTPRRPATRLRSGLRVLGPALRGTWLLALLCVALGALLLDHAAGYEASRTLLLTIAPAVPVAGVALSYGPHADPLHEIAAATPSGGLRLALTRTAAVLAVSLPLLTVTGAALPASGAPGAAAWLLPGLALTLGSLTLASFVGCRTATAVTGGGWLAAVLVPAAAAHGGPFPARLAGQLSARFDGTQAGWAAAAAACAVLLAARRGAYDHLENR